MSFMKKFLVLVLTISVLMLCSCSSDADNSSTTTEEASSGQTVYVEFTVEKGSLSDEASFVSEMEGYGAEVTDLTDENALSVKLSEADYNTLLSDKSSVTVKAFRDYETAEDNYVEKIEYDEDFRNMKFYVNREGYDAEGASVNEYLLAAKALAYQIYLPEGQDTYVEVIYSDTEEVATTFSLPLQL